MRIALNLFFVFFTSLALAQPTQIIKGRVTDASTQQPIVGATVMLADETLGIGANTDEEGLYRLEGVPVGRQTLICRMLGYGEFTSRDMIVSSAKEVELDIALTEEIKTGETVVITGNKAPDKPVNEFVTVSARSFTVEQVQRFPATVFDPGRMAMAYPGVQSTQDNNNDIVVRGNSSAGVLWRLEGIDIANPNHFARRGSTGGGITAFSLSLMAESDFSTGAFAPEYGNAFSSVFDMKFRKGNMEKREYTFRAGIIGLDFATEGPIKKGKSSYLVNYRYSTLGILNKIGFHLVGPRTNNTFQDLSFNLAFKTSQAGTLTVFGIGGISKELTSVVTGDTVGDREKALEYTCYNANTKTDFVTHTGAAGVTYTHLLNEKSFIKAVFVASASAVTNVDDTLNRQTNALFRINNEAYLNGRYSGTVNYNRKFSARLNMKTGLFVNNIIYNVEQSVFNRLNNATQTVISGKGNAILLQPYAQFRYRATEKLTFTGGLHAMYLAMNQKSSLEPRLSAVYQLNSNISLTAAYGLHSQVLPIGSYFIEVEQGGQITQPNKDLDFVKSHHFVFSYNHTFAEHFRVRVEPYYQRLFKLPVAADSSVYMPFNDRDGYARKALVSEGTGYNMGIDFTLEKFFHNRFFFLLGASVYESKYRPLDGKWYNTRYNGNYNSSFMFGKEFALKNNNVLEVGGRIGYGGNVRYALDSVTYLQDVNQAYVKQLPAMFRTDLRLAYRMTGKNSSSVLSLDIQNLTNRLNYTDGRQCYMDMENNRTYIYFKQQSTLTPVITYMIDF